METSSHLFFPSPHESGSSPRIRKTNRKQLSHGVTLVYQRGTKSACVFLGIEKKGSSSKRMEICRKTFKNNAWSRYIPLLENLPKRESPRLLPYCFYYGQSKCLLLRLQRPLQSFDQLLSRLLHVGRLRRRRHVADVAHGEVESLGLKI